MDSPGIFKTEKIKTHKIKEQNFKIVTVTSTFFFCDDSIHTGLRTSFGNNSIPFSCAQPAVELLLASQDICECYPKQCRRPHVTVPKAWTTLQTFIIFRTPNTNSKYSVKEN